MSNRPLDMNIKISAEAQVRYREACLLLERADRWAAAPLNVLPQREAEAEAGRREALVSRMRSSLHNEFALMLASHASWDGDEKVIAADFSPYSFLWRYPKSGYHGGLIFHRSDGTDTTPIGHWSIHT